MKVVVIYNSQTGFTKRYAQWIAEAAGAECVELERAKKRSFDDYDAIIFGGWACAGGISKLKWFKAHMDNWRGKKLIVYCVGEARRKLRIFIRRCGAISVMPSGRR